jgi:hypothetical protein
MVLILPEARGHAHCPAGATTAGLQSSIEHMLANDCEGDMSRVHVRILGSYVIIEGLIEDEESIPEIVAIAEGVAGRGNVRLRLFRH